MVSFVEDVKDRSNISKGCNAMCVRDVEDVKDRSNISKGCNAMCVRDVEDVKDRSNTPKDCNAMYVENIEDGKRTYRHILGQIHLRAVMLCMSIFNLKYRRFGKAET